LATLDAWHGFRDARLGQTREEIGGAFKLIGPYQDGDPSVLVFERTHDDLRFDDVPLTSIHYLFYEERLVRIALEADGRENTDRLEKSIVSHFGRSTDGLIGGSAWATGSTELLFVCTDEGRECTSAAVVFSDPKSWMKWIHSARPHPLTTEGPNRGVQPTRGKDAHG
jgi:hypothetical protein